MGSWQQRFRRALGRENEEAPPQAEGGVERVRAQSPPTPSAPVGTSAASVEILASLISTVIELADGKLLPSDIDPDVHIFDYGYVDSLSAVNLIAFIQERYGVEVPEVELAGRLSSLSMLADFLHSELAA